MRVFHFNSKEKEEMKLLHKIRRGSMRQFGRRLEIFPDLDTCLLDMEERGLVTLLRDSEDNLIFKKELVFFILDHRKILYMTDEEFNTLLIEP